MDLIDPPCTNFLSFIEYFSKRLKNDVSVRVWSVVINIYIRVLIINYDQKMAVTFEDSARLYQNHRVIQI